MLGRCRSVIAPTVMYASTRCSGEWLPRFYAVAVTEETPIAEPDVEGMTGPNEHTPVRYRGGQQHVPCGVAACVGPHPIPVGWREEGVC